MVYTEQGIITYTPRDIHAADLAEAFTCSGLLVYPEGTIEPDFTVMTYNCGRWYDGSLYMPSAKQSSYYAMHDGMLTAENADVVCIQEYLDVWSRDYHASDMLAAHYTTVHEEDVEASYGTVSRAICTNHVMGNDYETHSFPDSGPGEVDEGRYFDSVTITIDGRPVTFLNTHFNTKSVARRLIEVNALLAYLDTLDTFVACGDYNHLRCKSKADEDYAVVQQILNHGYRCANNSIFGFLETYSDAPTGPYTGCLDNVVTSNNIKVVSAHVNTAKEALVGTIIDTKIDHMPLVVGLKFLD